MARIYQPSLVTLLPSLTRAKVVIRDPQGVNNKLEKLIRDGADQLHVVSDYDMTLTKYLVNGQPNVISHAALGLTDLVSDSFKRKVADLHLEYLPYQVSTTMDYETKYNKMDECWNRYNLVYIEEKLSRDKLREALQTLKVEFRGGLQTFVKQLDRRGIPMTVLSAGVTDVIEELLCQNNLMSDNIHVISNKMFYYSHPPYHCINFTTPPIHILNKDKVSVTNPEHTAKLFNRNNILLIGDSLGDLKMSLSFQHQLVLSVGFLNINVEDKLETYSQAYDIVITNDGDFGLINDILQHF